MFLFQTFGDFVTTICNSDMLIFLVPVLDDHLYTPTIVYWLPHRLEEFLADPFYRITGKESPMVSVYLEMCGLYNKSSFTCIFIAAFHLKKINSYVICIYASSVSYNHLVTHQLEMRLYRHILQRMVKALSIFQQTN